jgi:hypothetical protein
MKKAISFFLSIAIAISLFAQEDKFQFGSFTNINYCGTREEFSGASLPTLGYQFGILSGYSLSQTAQIQFGMGLSETGFANKMEGFSNIGSQIKSIKNHFVNQDIMFPIAYKQNLRADNQFYWLVGLSLLIKYDRLTRTKTTLADGSTIKTSSGFVFESSRVFNGNLCLGFGYEKKIFKYSTLYIQPLFGINIVKQNSLNDFRAFQEFSGRFYTLGLTTGLMMD